MFDWKELRIMFNDPLDLAVIYINKTLVKNKKINLFFLRE